MCEKDIESLSSAKSENFPSIFDVVPELATTIFTSETGSFVWLSIIKPLICIDCDNKVER